MSAAKRDKLRRLVRLTRSIYEIEAARAAEVRRERSDLLDAVESAKAYIGRTGEADGFLTELAIARTARLLDRLGPLDVRLETQLASAVSALAGTKGAETRLVVHDADAAREAGQRTLDEAIAATMRDRTSLG
jgi:hypothetical protein